MGQVVQLTRRPIAAHRPRPEQPCEVRLFTGVRYDRPVTKTPEREIAPRERETPLR